MLTFISPLREAADLPVSRFVAPGTALPELAVRRILLPFDLSNLSVCALRLAARYAEQTGATLHLLHVIAPDTAEDSAGARERSDDRMADGAERLLKQWVARIVGGRARAFISIRVGDPVEAILARAIAVRADLIVMTSRSRGGLRNDLQRSRAERVSRLAPCPVLTIPEKRAREIAYGPDDLFRQDGGTIMLPVDFSRTAERALPIAAAIAAKQEAKLLLAHGSDAEPADADAIHVQLNRWAESILGSGIDCETVMWSGGHSLYAILSEAVRAEAQLIVLPTSVQPWTQRLRAGSITDGVLRQAGCAVLSVNGNGERE
jgi:nucleotide-binding universal stress UspA family protein